MVYFIAFDDEQDTFKNFSTTLYEGQRLIDS